MLLTTALILGATAITAGTLVAAYFNEIVSWLKKAVEKVKSIISGIHYGCKVFIKKMKEAVKEISKHYSKEGAVWKETVTTRTVSASEVPEEILKKAQFNSEYDITDQLEMELA